MVAQAAFAGAGLGLASGIVARLLMRMLFLVNPATEGLLVGETFPVGGFTAQGTSVILVQGTVLGALAGSIYGLARPSLFRRPLTSGLAFGGWLVAATLGPLVAGEERDFSLFGPFPIAAGSFGLLFVAFGVALGYFVDRTGTPGSRAAKPRRIFTWATLTLTGLLGALVLVGEISERT